MPRQFYQLDLASPTPVEHHVRPTGCYFKQFQRGTRRDGEVVRLPTEGPLNAILEPGAATVKHFFAEIGEQVGELGPGVLGEGGAKLLQRDRGVLDVSTRSPYS